MFTALSKYQEAVKANPNHPYAWAELARVHGMMRDADQALSEARKQLQVNPGHADANLLLAGLLMMRGDSDGALAALKSRSPPIPKNKHGNDAARKIRAQMMTWFMVSGRFQ